MEEMVSSLRRLKDKSKMLPFNIYNWHEIIHIYALMTFYWRTIAGNGIESSD